MVRSGIRTPLLVGLGAVDAAAYGVITPTLPELADRHGLDELDVGVIVAAFALAQVVAGAPLGAVLARRHGARRTIFGALAVAAAGAVAVAVAPTPQALIGARALGGLGAGVLWIGLVAAVLERTRSADVSRCLAWLLAGYSVGGIAGPGLAVLGGVAVPFLTYAVICAGGVLLAATLGAAPALGRPRGLGHLRGPAVLAACVGAFTAAVGFGVLEGPLALRLGEGFSQSALAALFVVAALAAGASGVLAERRSAVRVLTIAPFVVAASEAGIVSVSDPPAWAGTVVLAAIGLGATEAAALALLVRAVPATVAPIGVVIWSQAFALGLVVGPIGAGVAADVSGGAPAMALVPALAAACGAATALAARTAPRAVALSDAR